MFRRTRRRGGSNGYPQSLFWAEIWKISEFLSENFQFLMVKFSVYLNRLVFVMYSHVCGFEPEFANTEKKGEYLSVLSLILFPWLMFLTKLFKLLWTNVKKYIQLTLVISKSKGLSELLRDIHISTYKICRIQEKLNRTTTFLKWICNLTPEVRDRLKILWKRGESAPLEQYDLLSSFFFFFFFFVSCC